MNSSNSVSENLREKKERKEEIAKAFREGNYSLTKSDSEIIKGVEEAVLECLNYGWEIDSILEDDKISPYEFDQISSHLEKLGEVTKKLEQNDNENTRVINKILCIFGCMKEIIREVKYTVDVKRTIHDIQEFIAVNETGYVVEEDTYLKNLEELVDCLEAKKLDSSRQISKLEREIIKAIKTIGLIEREITLNVMYIKPSFLMKEIIDSIEILRATIEPIYILIHGHYFREEIKSAKIGISLMSEDKSLNVGEAIKIRGLFNRTKGIDSLEKLNRTIKSFDSEDSD
ncbi:MAG: hypothetical protein KAU62_15320 [Candidatus Heimdallarchaeota archaeon]|nr:hypothetical protein [Candidatus Heimdallarchaeota archaeon]MCG3257471.1 hypothetical protein [Candidatus Heimdallarchaeota archaeon]MCK4612524.1 hypothetical protein [Candidatus Heimdallarchaeota archaeon]